MLVNGQTVVFVAFKITCLIAMLGQPFCMCCTGIYVWSCEIITHASSIAAGVGKAFSRICLFVCLFVHALTGKRLELSTPNLVHIYSIAVARHALTHRLKGQSSRSHGYENHRGRTVASDECCYGCVLLLLVWVCISIVSLYMLLTKQKISSLTSHLHYWLHVRPLKIRDEQNVTLLYTISLPG